jgi:hypothetical protein
MQFIQLFFCCIIIMLYIRPSTHFYKIKTHTHNLGITEQKKIAIRNIKKKTNTQYFFSLTELMFMLTFLNTVFSKSCKIFDGSHGQCIERQRERERERTEKNANNIIIKNNHNVNLLRMHKIQVVYIFRLNLSKKCMYSILIECKFSSFFLGQSNCFLYIFLCGFSQHNLSK